METLFDTLREIWFSLRHGVWPELGVWSYALIVFLVATEGPLTTLLGAAAAAAGFLDVRYVFLSAMIGNIVGDCLWYTIGYLGGPETVYRFSRPLGLRGHHLDRLVAEVRAHAAKLIILAKISFGLIVPTLIAAGLARVPWRRWLPVVLFVEMLWTVALVAMGYHATDAIARIELGLRLLGVAVLLVVMAAVVWYARRFIRKTEQPTVRSLPTTLSQGTNRAKTVSAGSTQASHYVRVQPTLPKGKNVKKANFII